MSIAMPCPSIRKRLLVSVAGATALGTALCFASAADADVIPPASVPAAYTVGNPVATSTAGYTPGLTATVYQITPTAKLIQHGGALLEGGAGTTGYPSLQGMANLENLAQNGSISVGTGGVPSTGAGALTYNATQYATFTNTSINANHFVALGGTPGTIQTFLNGTAAPLDVGILGSASLPASATSDTWNNVILDQSGYVYAPKAGSYAFAVASNDLNDDGTEMLVGGNGSIGSGTVVAFQNAAGVQPTNGVATLANGNTYGAAVDTVTFSTPGLYRFELFNAQTWGNAFLNASFVPTSGNSADNLTFYTAVPEPATLGLLAVGCLALVKRRRVAA